MNNFNKDDVERAFDICDMRKNVGSLRAQNWRDF